MDRYLRVPLYNGMMTPRRRPSAATWYSSLHLFVARLRLVTVQLPEKSQPIGPGLWCPCERILAAFFNEFPAPEVTDDHHVPPS